MNSIAGILDRISLRWVLLFALVVVLLSGIAISVSLRGFPDQLVRFEQSATPVLGADTAIAAWITNDRDSYLLGEHALSRVRVLYRPAMVSPDFDRFKRNLGYLPFDQLGMEERTTDLGSGISEYVLDYHLLVVGARKPGNYPFNPIMLFYSGAGEPGSNLKSIRIPRPDLRIGSLYPWNAALIPLQPVREQIFDQRPLRQSSMIISSLILLLLSAFLLWRFGRRRVYGDLTEAEQLWNHYRSLDRSALGKRGYLLRCEHIFTRLLYHHTAMDPETFWSGAEPADKSWQAIVEEARQILGRLYQAGETTDDDVRRMDVLLAGILASTVEEQRLVVEQQPTLSGRLAHQQNATLTISGLVLLCLLMLVLALQPDWWLAPEVKQYNDNVARIRATQDYDETLLLDLQSFAASAGMEMIRTSAYYNSGTFRAMYGFSGMQAAVQRQIMELVFQAESADALLQTLLLAELLPSEEDVISTLVSAAENLLQAELDLQTAARGITAGNNQDILRNLELVTRWRHAILTRLVQLRDLFKMKAGSEVDNDIISDQGLVNVIEAKLPEEYEDAEMLKDNSSYIIFERF